MENKTFRLYQKDDANLWLFENLSSDKFSLDNMLDLIQTKDILEGNSKPEKIKFTSNNYIAGWESSFPTPQTNIGFRVTLETLADFKKSSSTLDPTYWEKLQEQGLNFQFPMTALTPLVLEMERNKYIQKLLK